LRTVYSSKRYTAPVQKFTAARIHNFICVQNTSITWAI